MTGIYSVGDILQGNRLANKYGITTEGAFVRVVEIITLPITGSKKIRVRMLRDDLSDDYCHPISFNVDAECFDLYMPNSRPEDLQDWKKIMVIPE